MIRKYYFIWIMIVSMTCLYGEELKEKKIHLIKTFQMGNGDGELGYINLHQANCPSGIGIDNNYNLYFSDTVNRRAVVFNNDVKFIKNILNPITLASFDIIEFRKDFIETRVLENSTYRKFDTNYTVIIDNVWGKGTIKLPVFLWQYGYLDSFLYKNLFIFNVQKDRNNTTRAGIASILNPSTDPEQNQKNFLNTEETRKLIKKKYPELTLDDKDRIIHEGKILTRIFDDYIEYWENEHIGKTPPQHALAFQNLNKYNDFILIGTDHHNNQYWVGFRNTYSIIVFDENGWVIDASYPANLQTQTYPAVHPLGDVYFLSYPEVPPAVDGFILQYPEKDEAKYDLYILPRTWGYTKTTPGTSTDDKVNIRLRPSTTSDKVTQLKKDEAVEILDKTDIKLKVGATENYWYKVKTGDGKMGWVYGDLIVTE